MHVALLVLPTACLSILAVAGFLHLARRYWESSLWPSSFDEGR